MRDQIRELLHLVVVVVVVMTITKQRSKYIAT
jgi:hypothetical protein